MLTGSQIRILPLLAAAILWPAFAQAEEPKVGQPSEKTDRPVWTLTLENDLTNDTDRYFTNGIRLSRTSPVGDVPESVIDFVQPLIGTVGTVRWTAAIGQNMYTPSDITVSNPDPKDQPYAAWLYGSFGLLNDLATGDGRRTQTSVQLSLGVIGPSAQGELAQKTVHEVINSPEPQGWDHQLHDEPAVLLNLERRWVVPSETIFDDLRADVSPHVGAALGNVFTHAAAGLTVRFGKPPKFDYGPPRLQPHTPGSEYFAPPGDDDDAIGWYLFAGVEGRAVARNIFLDGNTFRDSRSVDKELLVGDLSAGAVVTFGDVRLTYVQVMRTKEFDGQEGPSMFGGFSAGYRF
ncbi:lipid A deacylase LpxR family protein [Thalassobaculum sp.]|uniref:lipid A deacylase LpxR family protein n=1 Tax=Thalassobaculum sp. TaxID=2022740 RepID=UPI0032EF8770